MQQHHQRLLGAAGGDHVVGRDQLVVMLFGVANDGFLQRGNPIRRGVADLPRVQQGRAVDHRIHGRLTLGLAASQVNDGLALVAQQGGGFIQLEGRRLPNGPGKLAKTHDVAPFLGSRNLRVHLVATAGAWR